MQCGPGATGTFSEGLRAAVHRVLVSHLTSHGSVASSGSSFSKVTYRLYFLDMPDLPLTREPSCSVPHSRGDDPAKQSSNVPRPFILCTPSPRHSDSSALLLQEPDLLRILHYCLRHLSAHVPLSDRASFSGTLERGASEGVSYPFSHRAMTAGPLPGSAPAPPSVSFFLTWLQSRFSSPSCVQRQVEGFFVS